jgi:hypothetical protein
VEKARSVFQGKETRRCEARNKGWKELAFLLGRIVLTEGRPWSVRDSRLNNRKYSVYSLPVLYFEV